jgi:hypothetical protein
MTHVPRFFRLRRRLARPIRWILALLGALASRCSVPTCLRDPPGPIVPNWDFADQAGNNTDNQRGVFSARRPRDAGGD